MRQDEIAYRHWKRVARNKGKTWLAEPEPSALVKAQRYADWLIDTGRTVAWVYPTTPAGARNLLENSGLTLKEYIA